jgi:glycosyltransferase involved in cell wall biosynthesis
MRVLRIYHSAVVDEYRKRERLLSRRHGHDVHTICPRAWREGGQLVVPGEDPELSLHVVTACGREEPNLFWYSLAEMRKVIRTVRPEIVDVHEEPYSLAMAGALQAARLEAPSAPVCFYTAQNLPKRYPPPFCWIERVALSTGVAAYPCSTEAGERLRAQGFHGPVHVIPLGVTVPPPAPRQPGPPRVGFVGRLEVYKGGTVAIRAFAQAARNVDASLEVIGVGSQGAALRRDAAQAGLSDKVTFVGALPQGQTLSRIARFDILLVPSMTTRTWKEQFGRVAAQAMAAGTAVVASDSGSLREVVGDAGILVPEGDVASLAARLRELLLAPSRVAALGEAGRRRAIKSLSWEFVADRVDEMYRQMVHA